MENANFVNKKLLVFGLSLIALVSMIHAESIDISYPSVNYGESFEVNIKVSNFSGIYDTKIDILGDGKRIAKIYNNNKWQTTYNYILKAIDDSESSYSFVLNVTEKFNGNGEINIIFRKNSKLYKFGPYDININYENKSNSESDYVQVEKEKTILDINSEDEIDINKEFEAEIIADNLEEENYDLKVYVEYDGKIISQIYDKNLEKWKSGNYYVENIFEGPGKKRDKLKLRISEKNYTGEANIIAKLRKSEGSQVANANMNIELKRIIENKTNVILNQSDDKKTIEKEIIYLNPKDINTIKIWKSNTQYIKEYSIYFFTFFCLVIILIFIIKKWRI